MNTISVNNARRLRSGYPFHLPPNAQPLRSVVELTLEGVEAYLNAQTENHRSAAAPRPIEPEIVLTDVNRNYQWRVLMTADGPDRWKATVMLPQEMTIVKYHFLVGDIQILERRQVEGHNRPIYHEWTELEFKIAVYDPARMPADWTQGLLMYQIFPDRFANSNPERELTHPGVYGQEARFMKWGEKPEAPPIGRDFYGGDLRGIIDRLDYIKDLGIECIYMTPIFEAATNHRYEAINFMKIDPMLGTNEDFDELVSECKKRGIKIILDAVFNHCSSDSIYFDITGKFKNDGYIGAAQSKESPYYRWFKFKQWPSDYDGWYGFGFMPEFVECPEMEDYFLGENGVAAHWLKKGIDGWRCDVAFDNTMVFWRRMRQILEQTKPGAYFISEEWRDATHYMLGDTFNATMNYRFAWAVRGFLATNDLLPSAFDDRLQTWLRDTPPGAVKAQMNLMDSHDTDRLFTVCKSDRNRYKQCIAFQLSYAGAPMLYYGNETCLEGAYAEDGRRTMPWDNLDEEMIEFFKKAIQFRNQSKALRSGDVETVYMEDDRRIYVFSRRFEDELVYAVFNASDKDQIVEIPVKETGIFDDALGTYNPSEVTDGKLPVELKPYSMAWYCNKV